LKEWLMTAEPLIYEDLYSFLNKDFSMQIMEITLHMIYNELKLHGGA